VAEVARKHGATRWQIYDWRRRFGDQKQVTERPNLAGRVVGSTAENTAHAEVFWFSQFGPI
jgi:transposase-like protein